MISTPLHPDMVRFNEELSKRTPPEFVDWPLAKQRAAWNAVCASFRAPRPLSIDAVDLTANGVPCRVFKPKSQGPKPGIIYGHGGGWVLGGPETHDDMCAEMAAEADCVVVLMDYRLAPEHPHPAQLEDTLKVWRWMREQGHANGIDADNIVAAGDSAGGQISAALALTLRDLSLPQVKAMVLIYPVLSANMESPSYIRNANAPSLSRDEMLFYLRAFLGPEGSPSWHDEKALPLLASSLEGLPPAFTTVAAHDPLYDDGVMFHERLLKAGVPSELLRERELAHSYMRARYHCAPAMESFKAIVSALKTFAHA
jgi:acetyl esterase